MELVYLNGNKLVTDSLTVAETFGKRHDDVLKSIRNLDCSEEFSRRNFAETPYKHPQNGQTYSKYLITQDGFSFLVMGYTGKEAARFKEMYINEFNRMKHHHRLSYEEVSNYLLNPDTIIKIAENWKEEKMLRIAAENVIEMQRPLVVFAESLQVSKDTMLVGELAKLLKQNGIEVGQTRLFERLREEGYLHKIGTQRNLPTQKSMELGLMEIRLGVRASVSEGSKTTKTTKITGKGQAYFINKFKSAMSEAQ